MNLQQNGKQLKGEARRRADSCINEVKEINILLSFFSHDTALVPIWLPLIPSLNAVSVGVHGSQLSKTPFACLTLLTMEKN